MRHTIAVAVGLCFIVVAPLGAVTPVRNFDDAPLRAVQFVDASEGWVAGDEGVIWHTIDGGATWERQSTGTRASLRSIHFLTPFTGWVAGREELPYGGGSAGVLLVTFDGGLKWQRVATNKMPGLNVVRFFDDQNGVAAGDGNDQFPSGVFATSDGGRTWKPVPGPRVPSWLTGDFQDPKTATLAGAWSRLDLIRDGQFRKAELDTLGGRSILGVRVRGQRAVAVGQGGVILISRETAGMKWAYANLSRVLNTASLQCCDFHGVALVDDHTWVVGRPGTMILHSPDNGRNWEAFPTGQNVPLHGVHFHNDKEGWAVGELGTILATRDGGKTWAIQRRGGERAAVLCAAADSPSIPFDAVAQLGLNDGYLVTGLQFTAADPSTSPLRRSTDPERLVAAMRQSGGVAAESYWMFPLPEYGANDPRELLAAWDRLHGDKASDTLLRQLVLSLRMWQPEVVIGGHGSTPASGAVAIESIREAFARAADPNCFPEQIQQLGLKPWTAKKLYAVHSGTPARGYELAVNEPLAHLGDSPRDFATSAIGMVSDRSTVWPDQRLFTLIETRVKCGANGYFMDGVTLAHGGTARREQTIPTESEMTIAKARATAAREKLTLERLSNQSFAALGGAERVIGQLGLALKKMPADQGAAAAFGLANQYARAGQWQLAREGFVLMVDQFPADPLAVEAYRWLARFGASSEARRRHELGQFAIFTEMTISQVAGRKPGSNANPTQMTGTQELVYLTNLAETRQWYHGSLAVEPRLAAFGPLYATDPSFQFCLQSARRNLGDVEGPRKWYAKFLADTATTTPDAGPNPWRDVAAAELWLTNRTSQPPRPVGMCRLTTTRPYLDGDLSDDCWKASTAMALRPVNSELGKEYATKAFFAYDTEFIYIGIRCEHPQAQPVPAAKNRQHDQDLSRQDRVSIMLDLDRDYQTYYQLQFDQRGCVAEDCWGDATWNPRWFVAVKSEATFWAAEIAIPRTELTGESIPLGRVWATNVVRTIPGRGMQAWSTPAAATPRPEGMGLLIFAQDK
jgi:photosystem II stability/assembly factor-like uncharacterized protein